MEKVLILGGTNFIGRHLMKALIASKKYDLCMFNRGETNPELFPEVRLIQGDRNTNDVEFIGREHWDFIIDLSCYYPDSIEHIVRTIQPSPKRYIFISTCSVYDNQHVQSKLRMESAPTLSCSPEERKDVTPTTYGQRKAECERILERSSLNYSILRPALVFGEHDPTDRFYYWIYQIQRGHDLLVPNQGRNLFSLTYVKDLVSAILLSLNTEPARTTYNTISLPTCSIATLVKTASEILNKSPYMHAVDSGFLSRHGVKQWTDIPLWLDCDYFTYDNAKIKQELNLMPTDFTHSIEETVNYYEHLSWPKPNFGMGDQLRNELIVKAKNLT